MGLDMAFNLFMTVFNWFRGLAVFGGKTESTILVKSGCLHHISQKRNFLFGLDEGGNYISMGDKPLARY